MLRRSSRLPLKIQANESADLDVTPKTTPLALGAIAENP